MIARVMIESSWCSKEEFYFARAIGLTDTEWAAMLERRSLAEVLLDPVIRRAWQERVRDIREEQLQCERAKAAAALEEPDERVRKMVASAFCAPRWRVCG